MALWTPAELGASIVAWFDASDASSLTVANGRVSAWGSRNAAGAVAYSAAQSTAARRPYYESTAVDGKPAVRLSASDSTYLFGTASNLPQGLAEGCVALMAQSLDTSVGKLIEFGAATNSYRQLRTYGNRGPWIDFGTNGDDQTLSSDSVPDFRAAPRLVVQKSGGTPSSTPWVNGVAYATANLPYETLGQSVTIGCHAGAGGEFFTGYVFEVLYTNRALTLDERQRVEGYLAWRWGQSALLPAAHPYKAAAPTIAGGVSASSSSAMGLIGSSASALTRDVAASTSTLWAVTSAAVARRVTLAVGAAMLQPITGTASGTTTSRAAAVSELAPIGVTSTTVSVNRGNAMAPLGAIASEAIGSSVTAATASAVLGGLASAATGAYLAPASATATATLAEVGATSTAQVMIDGATLASLGTISSSSGAAAPVRATAAIALGSVTSLAASHLDLSAAGTAQLAQLGSSSAGYLVMRAAASISPGPIGSVAVATIGERAPLAPSAGRTLVIVDQGSRSLLIGDAGSRRLII